MALSPTDADKKAIENVNEITFEEMADYIYFNPIGFVDTITGKTGLKQLPFVLNVEIDKMLKKRWTYTVRVFYMGFANEFTPSKELLEMADLQDAVKIAQDDKILECRSDVRRKIIRSSELLSKKFDENLYWYAFWGFKKYLPLSRHEKK